MVANTPDQPTYNLARFLKASVRACTAFLNDTKLVAAGLRQAYLVDSLYLPEDKLVKVHDVLVKADPAHLGTFFLHEQSTMQTFLVNRDLIEASIREERKDTILVDVQSKLFTKSQDFGNALQNLHQAISSHLSNETSTISRVFSIDLTLSPWSLTPAQASRMMVSLTGYLLDYPFTYHLSLESQDKDINDSLNGERLTVVELLLFRGNDFPDSNGDTTLEQTVLKCSVPTASREAHQTIFQAELDRTISKHEQQLSNTTSDFKDGRLGWKIIDSIFLDKVSL